MFDLLFGTPGIDPAKNRQLAEDGTIPALMRLITSFEGPVALGNLRSLIAHSGARHKGLQQGQSQQQQIGKETSFDLVDSRLLLCMVEQVLDDCLKLLLGLEQPLLLSHDTHRRTSRV